MSVTVEILCETPSWDEETLSEWARAGFHAAFRYLELERGDWEISVLACDDARIAELNAEFRGKPTPTNVLSWPSEERGADADGGRPDAPDPDDPMAAELGDIAIAYETCAAEAEAANKPIDQHVTHLLVHALLHLLGYDHERDKDAALMEGIETAILASLGHPDPYRVD